MKKITVLVLSLALNSALIAQQAGTKDTIRLAFYNTGSSFLLKRAPYGEKTPKTELVKEMVIAHDSFVAKPNKELVNVQRKSFADIEKPLAQGMFKKSAFE